MSHEEIIEKKTATRVKPITGWQGDAVMFKLDPPLEHGAYVIASAVDLGISIPDYRTSETMVFPCNDEGGDVDFSEVGFVPFKSHVAALADMGYEVVA